MLIEIQYERKTLYLNTDNISQAYRSDQPDGKAWLVIYFIYTNPLSALHLRGEEALAAERLLQQIAGRRK